MARLGYKRGRVRMKNPLMDGQREARIRSFLVEEDRVQALEKKEEAMLVYMDESFVHQAQSSAYSYFLEDERGKVQDGFGRTSEKGLRMIMVHEITKYGPLVAYDESGFPIKEGWFKGKRGRVRGRPRADSFNLSDEPTAEVLWQARSSRGDYHATNNNEMFMGWLKHRLTPAFPERFAQKNIILVLDNAQSSWFRP